MNTEGKLMKIILPVLILIGGVGIMVFLLAIRPEPKKEPKQDLGALVNTVTAQKEDRDVIVTGTGTVQAAQEVSIIPQVSGKIDYVSPSMVAGGFLKQGDLLFEIEDTDYRLALEQAKAARAKAEYDLATTESQARVARAEWERLNKDKTTEPNPLVLYEPQLANARASLASAEAAVEQAELNLKRTELRAPFNCRIRSENVDLGQYVRQGNSVAVVAGTDSAEIIVPLSLDELGWLKIPKPGTHEKGSLAVVVLTLSGKAHNWNGRIIRSLGEIDEKSRMMQVIVGIQDPYRLSKRDARETVLRAGAFVQVNIQGKQLTGVFPIPRTAVRDNSTVWIMDDESMLRIRPVTIAYRERSEVLISDGLSEGEHVVLTSLTGASDGMKLRALEKEVRK